MTGYRGSIRAALFLTLFLTSFLLIGILFSGCGYTLQSTRTNSLKELNIDKVYVAPVKNTSFKPGVENLVYNELIQSLMAGKRVKIVDRPELADAILQSTILTASYRPTTTTSSGSIFPTALSTIQIMVATEYQATVTCSFALRRQKDGFARPGSIWESSFTRSRRFAGNNQKAEFGTTSALINESEFERALREVAHGMMLDVHEAMVARF